MDRISSTFKGLPWSRARCADNDSIKRFTLIVVLAALTLGSTGPIDPAAYYQAVLLRMRSLREPSFAHYRTVVYGESGSIVVARGDRGDAQIALVSAPPGQYAWDAAYRASDSRVSIELGDGKHAISTFPLFDPTWNGAFEWLRHGMAEVAPAATASPVTPASPSAQPSATEPPIVAVVTAIGTSFYDIADGGEATCPDGKPARRLRLRAKDDSLEHPLTQALVDDSSQRICTMRFHEHLASPAVVFDADIELHFAQTGAYYLVSGGTIAGAVRPVRRPGWFRMDASFVYENVTFPQDFPGSRFELQPIE